MSKESYARGFCKAAEAAGVNPEALAKFAQQYKTDGYAPREARFAPVKGEIPAYNSRGSYLYDWRIHNPEDAGKNNPIYHLVRELALARDPVRQEQLRQKVFPKHKAWVDAHTNAVSRALAPFDEVDYKLEDRVPGDILDAINKIYHDEMKRTTSAPPVQISAPVKK